MAGEARYFLGPFLKKKIETPIPFMRAAVVGVQFEGYVLQKHGVLCAGISRTFWKRVLVYMCSWKSLWMKNSYKSGLL